ncbi:hypothetical protein SUGI_0770440 [Cryptomeria japonica]|uniref:fasciclin-like arabinogalactan protein 6 n=1 Tax=Cryptomeria japonica TaxID=3369 RepID=UPI0024149C3B|nr:fasciclin-like arabinogalactan protein 6 [Cryptomeria japonica]GLJ37872.1 hypothetical protein SUGI_0770440 [Cryptomeria japonica]
MKMRVLICIALTFYFVGTSVSAANVTNITGVLDKGGQFTTFMNLLSSTQVGSQLQNQLNNSQSGLTIFAPTDNAFQELKPGALNSITDQQKVALLLYHVLPSYYALTQFQTLSNPLRTQATGNSGLPYNLNVTTGGVNQVNVSTGLVDTPISNSLYSQSPLAIYQVEKVLLPTDIFAPAPTTSPTPSPAATKETKTAPTSSATSPSSSTRSSTSGSMVVTGSWVQGLSVVFGCFIALFL